jgi:hypothetical protein
MLEDWHAISWGSFDHPRLGVQSHKGIDAGTDSEFLANAGLVEVRTP